MPRHPPIRLGPAEISRTTGAPLPGDPNTPPAGAAPAAAPPALLPQPSRVSALVLVSPGLTGYSWPEDPGPHAEFVSLAAAGDIDGVAALIERIWAAAGPGDGVAGQLRSAARAWLANGDFEQQDPPAVDRLGDIAVPAVLMVGDKDHPPLIACDEVIVAGIPGCRKVEVPGGDHLLPLRVPGLVADTITELAG